ncbi:MULTISPECIES: type IV pilus modification PilV family protein [Aeromonas]|uniref:type IV pilus modification PilV family protein n=1 Tax=Aeromonas TaxID=642 RepID=UPI00192005C3|nr:prepilin-type N-terminal cleavage/methylation domain-containing protein [Aeromonas enteropelogenes]MBL0522942.1 prepilin-type N-terminal cleavage/methylation domain-containing protein [Aeromonas enteropelogenes]BEE16064.1 MSHA biogenesis protein MshD [Aeromonas enteropelogenes]BEE20223.1 MSHA biogenesis protein MshD [Aeromonas enteropelogenes]
MRSPERGFTLIELIVGIVLLAVALTGILGLLINQAPRAVDPVQQVRAAQLAQRLAGEILQKSFDEQSDHNGGRYRCGETVTGVTIPACSTSYGPDGEPAPYAYNDVDDFDTAGNWVDANRFTQTSAGVSGDEYPNYQVKIAVSGVDFSDGSFKSCSEPCSVGKRIELQVRLPDRSVLDFSLYRGNY